MNEMNEPLTYSYLHHTIDDMHDDEEFQAVEIVLPDGRLMIVVQFRKNSTGQWQLHAEESLEPDRGGHDQTENS